MKRKEKMKREKKINLLSPCPKPSQVLGIFIAKEWLKEERYQTDMHVNCSVVGYNIQSILAVSKAHGF